MVMKEHLKRFAMVALLSAAAALAVSCSDDATSSSGEMVAKLRISADISATTINTLVVEVAADDIDVPLLFNIGIVGGEASGTIELPAGSRRRITVRAFDAWGIQTHQGSTTIDVRGGSNPLVTVTLLPIAGEQPVDVRFGSITLAVTPGAMTLRVDQQMTFIAAATDGDGNVVAIDEDDLRWATLDPARVTVDTRGLVTAKVVGEARIVATYAGVGAAATVTIEPSPFLVAAGDIVECERPRDEATAALVDAIPGTVAVLGDNVYELGSLEEYQTCYEPSWGRHKSRTMPTMGNHDYDTPGAAGYFAYFGAAAGEPGKGWYSYDRGAWHIIVLNSNEKDGIDVTATSEQVQWLRADLAANPTACTLAYWHHPRFSSGFHGNDSDYEPFWQALYDAGADVVLTGHDHNYERFASQTPKGVADPVRGIRAFVVGTGGTVLRPLDTPRANSEVFDATHYGVLKLVLKETGYAWSFITIPDGAVFDAGTGTCH